MSEILHLEIRKKIYKILLVNPGLNLSKIAELLNISVPLADYHLHHMEENDLITISKEGGYKRYYVKGKIGIEDKKILSMLYRENVLKIVFFFLRYPHSKPLDIRKEVDISPALLTYYLKKLVKHGILASSPHGGKKHFVIADENKIIRLLIQYKPNLLFERFKDTWTVEFPLSGKVPKNKKE